MTILVTNDDGIYGPGLKPLVHALRGLGKVITIVPDKERSGTSHSITLHKPFRVECMSKDTYIANGTPADCVKYGIRSLVRGKTDMVVSGINSGPNLGQDVIYSGTVAGAREGALHGVAAIAISVADLAGGDFVLAAGVARDIVTALKVRPLPEDVYLNVNVPRKAKGMAVASVGQRIYDHSIECRTDPRGRKYYWLAGKFISGVQKAGTDIAAVNKGYTSVTPLHLDPTDLDTFPLLEIMLEGSRRANGKKV